MREFLINNGELISILAGIGTFISSIIAVYTLIEVKKQRLSTYKPQLLMKSFLVYISKSPLFLEKEELLGFKVYNYNEYKEKSEQSEIIFDTSPLYKAENLGFGPAVNIKFTWYFNMSRALKIIEKELHEDLYFSEYKPLNYFFLHKKSDNDFQLTIHNKKQEIQTVDYIAPINVKEHTHYHTISKDVINIHFLYYILKCKLTQKINKNVYGVELNNLPRIKLRIDYFDLNGKKYTKKYKFQTSIVTTQIEDEIDMTKDFAYLLFEII